MKYAIEIKNLTKRYSNFALENLNLTVPSGSILGLIGENGAGKSTTIKCILDLVQADSGSITVLGTDHRALSPELKEKIGVVLDESTFHDSLSPNDVNKILSKVYTSWDTPLFDHYLYQFDLPRSKKVKEFSRGMKMKLSIACALAHHPSILLLDEATGGLDPVVRNEILDEFLSFIQDEEHAILISSHITSDLEKVCDYIAYLHNGELTLSGEKDALLETHGRLACSKAELAGVDPSYIVGNRTSQFNCEALIRNRREFTCRYPNLTVDPVSLEEIMVFTVRGDAQ